MSVFVTEANHQLESRMRENRQSGSEGGVARNTAIPTPMCASERTPTGR